MQCVDYAGRRIPTVAAKGLENHYLGWCCRRSLHCCCCCYPHLILSPSADETLHMMGCEQSLDRKKRLPFQAYLTQTFGPLPPRGVATAENAAISRLNSSDIIIRYLSKRDAHISEPASSWLSYWLVCCVCVSQCVSDQCLDQFDPTSDMEARLYKDSTIRICLRTEPLLRHIELMDSTIARYR